MGSLNSKISRFYNLLIQRLVVKVGTYTSYQSVDNFVAF